MGKTIRHNRNGEAYKEKDCAGKNFHTNVNEPCGVMRGVSKRKSKDKLHSKYGKSVIRYDGGYPNERDAQSDRDKGYKRVENKLLRRGLQREAEKIINNAIAE